MEMVKSEQLRYSYIVRDDEERETAVEALKGIDLSVEKGEFVAILGSNGSGKSTLARHINALLSPSSGTLRIDGLDALQEENVWTIRGKAGMIFQNPDNQLVSSVVEEDVAFGPENLGIPSEEIIRRVEEALNCIGMSEYAQSAPNKLSGGQKQRVAIAGVLAMKTDCIVLDEPTAMLDPSGRREVLETVKRLNREEGITVIYITHYMEETVSADRLFVMDHGEVKMSGRPAELFTRVEEMKALGLDVPPMTELAYRLRRDGFDIPADILTADEMAGALCR